MTISRGDHGPVLCLCKAHSLMPFLLAATLTACFITTIYGHCGVKRRFDYVAAQLK